jgi:DNA-binding SARP family transcriptional activator
MSGLSICLFGRFRVRRDEQALHGLDARKAQELFAYLLLHRGHPQSRELLAGLLWGDSSTDQSRKYLRQALWQLQTALGSPWDRIDDHLLIVEPDWVDLNPRADLWLDVGVFEQACTSVKGVPSQELSAEGAQSLEAAVQLYQGDLLGRVR